jgi:iron(II)-dependent oxidoreductase
MQQSFRLSVLVVAGLASCIGFVTGMVHSDSLLCAGSVVGICFLATRIVPGRRRQILRRGTLVEDAGFDAGDEITTLEDETELTAATGDCSELAARMLREGRYALLTRPQIVANLTAGQQRDALGRLRKAMALLAPGAVLMRHQLDGADDPEEPAPGRLVKVDAFFLDRYCVTNRQYRAFIAAGGYEEGGLWDCNVWPGVADFVDRSGHPGPRFWCDGMYPVGEDQHPVVGISWFEAQAYARWVGKRLPSDPEWVRAASRPVLVGDGELVQRKYPWGDLMDRRQANVWGSGPGRTVPVKEFAAGAAADGVLQLCGNVWEWTAGEYGGWLPPRCEIELPTPMRAIRGGAFDTYFENQVSCHFQSGERPLARKPNIGFRCALSACDVAEIEATAATGEAAADDRSQENPSEAEP